MLPAGDEAIKTAYDLNAASRTVDWQATCKQSGTLEEWVNHNGEVCTATNAFHESLRVDRGDPFNSG